MVYITKPKNNTKVGVMVAVKGIATGMVQLYVFAKDDKWYLQPLVNMVGNKWNGKIYLGDQQPAKNAIYTIAAVLTDQRPKTPLTDLPNHLTAKIKVKIK